MHAPEHDHRYEAAAIKAERQDSIDNPSPVAQTPPADRQGAVLAESSEKRVATSTIIELYRLDYLPRSKQRPGYPPYKRTDLKPIMLPFDAYCSDVDEAAFNERRKQGATHFQARNDIDGIWYTGAIF